MKAFLGSGCLFIDRLTSAGAAQGLIKVGNATQFAIQPDADKKELVSRQCDSYGKVLATVTQPKPATVAITLDEWDRDSLAMALFGDVAATTVTGASVTDEEITARHDKWSELDYKIVSAVTVTGPSGTPTYVLDTDYEVDAEMGMIKALSGGSITDGATIEVDYTYASRVYDRVTGGTESNIKARLLLKGKNQVNSKPCTVDVYEAQLAPKGGLNFLSDDFAAVELEGTLVTPSGSSEPFDVEYEE